MLAAVVVFVLQGILYGVQPLAPLVWGLACTAMTLAAGLANFVPARRRPGVPGDRLSGPFGQHHA